MEPDVVSRVKRPLQEGEKILVHGMGKHREGTFVRYDETEAGIPYVEYRCKFNSGLHSVLASRVVRKPQPRADPA